MTRLLIGVLLVIAASGCDGDASATVPTETRGAGDVKASRLAGRGSDPHSLEHDFGYVRPGSKSEHRFSVTNTTDKNWTLEKIHSSCACTASSSSSSVYRTGRTETVDLTYTAGKSSGDDRRKVVLEFNEPDAPPIELIITAKVRGEMTCFPEELSFGQISETGIETQQVTVHNFSDSDWNSISISSPDDWLTHEAERLELIAESAGARQTWRVMLTADGAKLATGRHQAMLTIAAETDKQLETTVLSHVEVIPRVRTIPAQLFFGSVRPGSTTTRKVLVHFSQDSVPPDPGAITFSQEPKDVVQLAWSRTTGSFWELTATLNSPEPVGVIDGRVQIVFNDDVAPMITLPIRAKVDAP